MRIKGEGEELVRRLDLFTVAVAAIVAVLVALHPARHEMLRAGSGVSPTLMLIAGLSAIPLVGYALDQASKQRTAFADPHTVLEHWTGMTALAIALPLVAILAALRTTGWRVPSWSAGGAAVVLGLASVLFPDQVSSFGTVGGGAAMVAGVLFISLAEREIRSLAFSRSLAPALNRRAL